MSLDERGEPVLKEPPKISFDTFCQKYEIGFFRKYRFRKWLGNYSEDKTEYSWYKHWKLFQEK